MNSLSFEPGRNGTPQAQPEVSTEGVDSVGNAPPPDDGRRLLPQGEPLPTPRRKVDLSTVAMPVAGKIAAVESLVVRDLKGPGAIFSAKLESALTYHCLISKHKGTFKDRFDVIAGSLLADPRLTGSLRRVTFIPAFHWGEMETVLLPIKDTEFGKQVLIDLHKVQSQKPLVKTYIQWSDDRGRHVVYFDELTPQQAEIIAKVSWPTTAQIQDALSGYAYDTLEDLAAANENVKAMLTAREVE